MLPSFSLLVPRSYKLFAIHKCLFPTPPTPHFTLPPSITNLIQCTSQIRKNMQSTKSTLFIYLCALLKFCSKNQKGSLQRKPFKQRKKQTPLEAGCSLTLYNGGNHDTIYDQKAQKEAGLPTYLNATVTNTNSNGNCCELELELEHQLERELVRTPTRTRTGMAASGGQITYVMRKKWRKSFGYWTRGGKMDFWGFSTYERDNIGFLNKTDVK